MLDLDFAGPGRVPGVKAPLHGLKDANRLARGESVQDVRAEVDSFGQTIVPASESTRTRLKYRIRQSKPC